MRKIVGIQVGEARVSAIVVGKQGKQPVVLDFATASLSREAKDSGQSAVADAVNLVLNELRIPTEDVVVSLPTSRCVLSNISLPFTNPRKISATVKYDAEKDLPCSADSMVLGWFEIGRTENSVRAMTAAAKKEIVEEYVSMMQRCGVEPVGVHPEFCALLNLDLFYSGSAATRLFICLNESRLHIASIADGKPLLYDETEMSGEPASQVLARRLAALECNTEELAYDEIVVAGQRNSDSGEFIAALGDKAKPFPIENILTKLPLEKIDAFTKHGLIPLGLVLSELFPMKAECDFRREEFAYPHKLQPFELPLAILLCGLILTFFILGFAIHQRASSRNNELTAINAQIEKRWHETFQKTGTLPAGAITQMEAEVEKANTAIAGKSNLYYMDYTLAAVTDIVKKINAVEGEGDLHLVIKRIEIAQGSSAGTSRTDNCTILIFEGVVTTRNALVGNKIVSSIESSPYAASVEGKDFKPTNEGLMPLNLKILIREKRKMRE